MIEAGLIAARLLHYLAVLALFGATLFPFYAYWSGEQPHQPLISSLRRVVATASTLAVLSAGLWLVFAIATMAGTLSEALVPETFLSVVNDTSFGRIWLWRLALGLFLMLWCIARLYWPSKRGADVVALAGAAVLLATIAGTGHTQTYEGTSRLLHMASDGVHLLAAGTWLGGLVALALLVAPSLRGSPLEAHRILARFSGVGIAAVAALVVTGLVNSWFLVGNIGGLFGTPYGQLLCIKLGAFLAMVGLAGLNRYRLVPALTGAPLAQSTALARLRRHIYAEQALGIGVIVIVALIGTLQPAQSPF
jgi:putative copper resistance protein D